MKTKIFALLLMFASIAYNASAYRIVIRGGSSSNRYYEIIVTDNKTTCKGHGFNSCPVWWSNNDGHTKIAGIPLNDVMGYVSAQLKSGKPQGNIVLNGTLPLYWKTVGEDIEIDMKSDDIVGFPNAEN